MRAFLTAAWNEIRIEFSERGTILFFAVLPLLFTAVIGVGLKSIGSDEGSEGDNRFTLAVVQMDNSELSQMFIEVLDQSNTVRPVLLSSDEARTAQQKGETSAILTIPESFSEAIRNQEQIILPLEIEQGLTAAILAETLYGAAIRTSGAVMAGTTSLETAAGLLPFESEQEEQRYLDDFYKDFEISYNPPPLQVQTESAGVIETTVIPSGFNQSSPGQLVTWTLITFLGTSIVFVNERRMGTLRRLLTMPVPRVVLLGGKIFGRLSLGLIQMTILIVSGVFVFGVSWGGSPGALILLAVCFGLAATSLGLFIATLVKTPRQADSVSIILSMGMSALGGAWWPMEITGETYRAVVQVLPSTWAMRGFNDIILRGQGTAGILLESGVLLGFAAFFFLLSWWRFRFE